MINRRDLSSDVGYHSHVCITRPIRSSGVLNCDTGLTPHALVLADAAASAVNAHVPLPLVHTDTDAAAEFALTPPPFVLAEAAAATVCAPSLPLVAEGRGLAGLLGLRRM